ncbi:MAG: NUDIX hydrolase [Phycisphaerales bacterium]|nr:MAG: NUDIX hydrolase [Phycisphaerales bacterium]
MRKQLLSTRLFTVEHRVYTRPGREPVARDVVVHPGAVVILPIVDTRRMVMIRNYRYAVEDELWELPAGTLEPNEEPIETARRELEEETGYRAARMRPLMDFFTSPGFLTERMHAFVATDLTVVGQRLQGAEQIVSEVVDVTEVRDRLLRGEFVDGKTIAVLSRYFLGAGA